MNLAAVAGKWVVDASDKDYFLQRRGITNARARAVITLMRLI